MTFSDISDTCVPEDGSDWSELSELSSSEEEEEDESSEGEGWGSDADEPPKKRTKAHRTLPAWGPEVQKAFMRAVHLFPALGSVRYRVEGQLMARSDLISEYIRRQTGHFRDRSQVNGHLRAEARGDARAKDGLRGRPVSDEELARIDWSASLGPDNFPHVKPTQRKRRSDAVKPVGGLVPQGATASCSPRASKRRKGESSTPSKAPCADPSPPPVKQLPQLSKLEAVDFTPAPARSPVLLPMSTSSVSTAPPFPPSTEPDDSLSPTVPRVTNPQGFLPSLVAFLTSIHRTRDQSLAARALLDSGVDSLPALVDLLALDQSTLDDFLELVCSRAALGGLEAAWLRKVVGTARDACAGRAR